MEQLTLTPHNYRQLITKVAAILKGGGLLSIHETCYGIKYATNRRGRQTIAA